MCGGVILEQGLKERGSKSARFFSDFKIHSSHLLASSTAVVAAAPSGFRVQDLGFRV